MCPDTPDSAVLLPLSTQRAESGVLLPLSTHCGCIHTPEGGILRPNGVPRHSRELLYCYHSRHTAGVFAHSNGCDLETQLCVLTQQRVLYCYHSRRTVGVFAHTRGWDLETQWCARRSRACCTVNTLDTLRVHSHTATAGILKPNCVSSHTRECIELN